MATLKGHKGRGVWCCGLWGPLLASGGNDACIRVWNISQWHPTGPIWEAPPAPTLDAGREPGTPTTGQDRISAGHCQNRLPLVQCASNTAPLGEGSAGDTGQGMYRSPDGAVQCGDGAGRGAGGGEVVVDIPRAGPRDLKPQGREKVKCLVLASRTMLYIATAEGVLWKTRIESCDGVGAPTWSKVWESRNKSPINCLVVVQQYETAADSAVVGSTVSCGKGAGIEPHLPCMYARMFLGSQDGSVALLRDASCDGTDCTEKSETKHTSHRHRVTAGCDSPADKGSGALSDAHEECKPPVGGRQVYATGAKPGGADDAVLRGADNGSHAEGRSGDETSGSCHHRERAFGGASEVAHWAADSGLPVLKLVPLGRPAWLSVVLTVTTGKRLRLWHVEGCVPLNHKR